MVMLRKAGAYSLVAANTLSYMALFTTTLLEPELILTLSATTHGSMRFTLSAACTGIFYTDTGETHFP